MLQWSWRLLLLCGWIGVGAMGCSSDKPAPLMVLDSPFYATPHAKVFLEEGNRFFKEGRWEAARQQFLAAIERQADLAEAHYNLALSLERMGDRRGAKPHYIQAANLAPGHKIIWDSPPLRRYGNVPDSPDETIANPTIPQGFGGGGPTGIAGGGF